MSEIELTPSVPVTPSEEPAAPAEVETEVDTPAVDPEPQLYELPDGRKVDAETLSREWKENFLPDYTKKSQTLAEIKRAEASDPNVPEWKKEGYTPKSYAELIELGKQEALKEITTAAAAEEAKRIEISELVDSQVAILKAKDPKLDENALFAHANKYGFRDLSLAYQNMSEMKTVARVTEERVVKGNAKKVDPIATGTGSGSGGSIRYPQATSATEFLARLKK